MIVKQLICSSILALRKTDTVELALGWMDEFSVSHLPLIDGDEYLGLICDNEILDIGGRSTKMSEFCDGIAKPYILDGEHYYNALQIMLEHNFSVLPVLDEKHAYIGVIIREKILNEMAESISVQNPGGIIVLELKQNDYTLNEISRIVESNDAKILSLNIRPAPDSTKLEITLKVNRINIEAIIHSFERFDYEIKSYFGETQKHDDLLRERYESLLKYLNY